MKHLFFVAVASSIFLGTTIVVKAQTNVNIERQVEKPTNTSLRFIEGIEINARLTASILPGNIKKLSSTQLISAGPDIEVKDFLENIEACTPLQFKFAMLMNRNVESLTNFTLYNYINEWWGTRYRYGGTGKNGIDCSAFTSQLLSRVYGITVPRTAKNQFDICTKINTDDLIEGDLVFFNTKGRASHVGLYLGNDYFVHSSVHGGVIISNLSSEYYSKKFLCGGRPDL